MVGGTRVHRETSTASLGRDRREREKILVKEKKEEHRREKGSSQLARAASKERSRLTTLASL
jgi:hypothetical protein